MPTLSLDFEVFCSCGNGLCNSTTEGSGRNGQYITIEPCKDCLERRYEEGVEEGYQKGLEENKE